MMFTMAVKLKLVSHHVFDICEDSLDETEEALAEERSWPIGSVVFSWLCDKCPPFKVFIFFDNSHGGAPKAKSKKEDSEMDERSGSGRDGEKGKDKGGEAQEEIDGWSDLESEDKKRGTDSTRRSLGQRIWRGKLLDGKKQATFEPKFKEKEVKEIINLTYKEQELEGLEKNDGRKLHERRVVLGTPHTEEMIRYEWNPIRNMKITYMGVPMGILGMAAAWRVCDAVFAGTGKGWWATFGIAGAALLLLFAVMYLVKMFLYPRKVLSEWDCPIQGPFFSAVTIDILLLSFLIESDHNDLAKVLFWIAAPVQLFLGVNAVARWALVPHYIETINPNWMIPVVGNLVAALVAPRLDDGYDEVAWLWYGFAILYWIPLFVMSVLRVTTREALDDRLTSSLFVWLAAISVACSSYVAIKAANCHCDPWELDYYPRMLYFAAVGIFLVLAYMTLHHYFGRNRFEMSYWGYTFPLATLSMVTMDYYQLVGSGLLKALSWMSLILVTFVVAMCALHTLVLLQKRADLFVPNEKWGPLSFMKIIHFALRGATKKLERFGRFLDADDERSIVRFVRIFKSIHMMHAEHSQHEEQILYPFFNSYFPGYCRFVGKEHTEGEHELAEAASAVESLLHSDSAGQRASAVQDLKKMLPTLIEHLIEHLDYEELYVNHVPKKYFNPKITRKLTRQIWESTSAEKWAVLVPFVINFSPLLGQKARFLRCLRWAMPERIQQVGGMVYDGVSPTMWQRLTKFVPEMAPRGVFGWTRYY